jgi:hypothetical protein
MVEVGPVHRFGWLRLSQPSLEVTTTFDCSAPGQSLLVNSVSRWYIGSDMLIQRPELPENAWTSFFARSFWHRFA